MDTLYTDFWELIAQYLTSDDLFAFSMTCKLANRACKRPTIQKIISLPMIVPYKLTAEQREVIKIMEKKKRNGLFESPRFKLIHGDVGSGKTITSIAYAMRKYPEEDSKIVMCGPPNLIKMWWVTLNKYFGIEPMVFHGSNTKYNAKTSFVEVPTQKFILISYKVYQMHQQVCHDWFLPARDILILDEAHHHVSIDYTRFKEVIGLSATTTKKSGLSRGIRSILSAFDLKEKDCTYTLTKTAINRKLPEIKYHSYMLNINPKILNECYKYASTITNAGTHDKTDVEKICKVLSHPEIVDLDDAYSGGFIMVNRKRFMVPEGNYKIGRECMKKVREEIRKIEEETPDGIGNRKKLTDKLILSHCTFNIKDYGSTYPKHVQALHIIVDANKKGEKVILFDTSTEYLPFLHQFLTHYGVNSYIFSTHYDVTGRQRQLTKFKEDPKPGVILSSIGMLGEGQNITEANHVIFFTQCMDSTKYHQAIGRAWRPPQNKPVHVHLLFAGMFDQQTYIHACGGQDISKLNWVKMLKENKIQPL
jgi:superfamily II DNA or RNA helicase